MRQTLTTIYWNTWFELQDGKRDDGTLVTKRLQDLIDSHDPDAFGLNEVYFRSERDTSPIVELLQKNGYHTHFARQIVGKDDQIIGNLFASKRAPIAVADREFGQHARSHISWYKEYTPRIVEAKLQIGSEVVTLVVVHLGVIVPSDILTHIRHRASYDRLVAAYDTGNLIIGGDFNELKYTPPWLHMPRRLKRLTGTLLNPTWLLNGKRSHVLCGNMDNVIYATDGTLRLAAFEVLDRHPSDHAPLLARFHIG